MSFTVYILYSLKDKKLYVGCTSNIGNRMEKHSAEHVQATKNRRPLILIYKEEFGEKAKAFNRERFFKSLWGAREKKNILKKFRAKSVLSEKTDFPNSF